MWQTELPAPRTCPRGHLLGPYQILPGWQYCDCPPARDHHQGHRIFTCTLCRREGWSVVCYRPCHIPRPP